MSLVESLNFFLLQAIYGLGFGLLYGLIAAGLALIFGVMKIINFAHGEFYMLGGYTYFFLIALLGINPVLGILSAALVGAALGILVERLILSPIYKMSQDRIDEYAILSTFALSIFLQNLALYVFGFEIRTPPPIFDVKVSLGLLELAGDRVFAIIVASALLVGLYLYMRYSWVGTALRAVSQNRDAAAIVGIKPWRMNALSMAMGGALAAIAGSLLSNILLVYPDVGLVPTIKAFVVIVLGGMGSIFGSIMGGITLGLVEAVGSAFISVAYRDAYSFIVLILVLLLRPHGLFGERARIV